jgi:hypothetical protein
MWDRPAIDAKLDEICGLVPTGKEEAFARWEREKGHRSSSHGTDVAAWRAQKEKRRAKYRPQMGLSIRLETTLAYMAAHPEYDLVASIPAAGQAHLDLLI